MSILWQTACVDTRRKCRPPNGIPKRNWQLLQFQAAGYFSNYSAALLENTRETHAQFSVAVHRQSFSLLLGRLRRDCST